LHQLRHPHWTTQSAIGHIQFRFSTAANKSDGASVCAPQDAAIQAYSIALTEASGRNAVVRGVVLHIAVVANEVDGICTEIGMDVRARDSPFLLVVRLKAIKANAYVLNARIGIKLKYSVVALQCDQARISLSVGTASNELNLAVLQCCSRVDGFLVASDRDRH